MTEGRRYILHTIPEYLLCLAVIEGVGIGLLQGFLVPERLAAGWGPLLILGAILLVPLFAAAYSRRGALLGVLVGAALIVLAVVILRFSALTVLPGEDPEDNAGLWALVSVTVTVVVFLLTRSPGGTAVLFAAEALVFGGAAVLEYTLYPVALLLALVGTPVLYLFRRYRKNVLQAGTGRSAFRPLLLYGFVMTVVALGASCLLWFGVIRPMNPQAEDLRLIVETMSVEVLERIGVASPQHLVNDRMSSSTVNDDYDRLTSQTGTEDETIPDDGESGREDTGGDTGTGSFAGGLSESADQYARAIIYVVDDPPRIGADTPTFVIWIATAVALLLPWCWRRGLRLRAYQKYKPEEQIVLFYCWMLKKFRFLGLPDPSGDTPYEYAARTADSLAWLTAGGVDWQRVTELYVQASYTGLPLTAKDAEDVQKFYAAFHKNCRRRFGGKYFLLYFVL